MLIDIICITKSSLGSSIILKYRVPETKILEKCSSKKIIYLKLEKKKIIYFVCSLKFVDTKVFII